MTRIAATIALILFVAAAPSIAGADAAEAPKSSRPPPIKLPDGFGVEVVAAPPLVQAPTYACFDERGRLFVCESFGVNVESGELLKTLPRAILMLEETDGDGRFDRRTEFADKLTFPMGAQWHDGALFVVSPPHVWRLEDVDDDGVADRRDVVVSGIRWNGDADSFKGRFFGPDGRFYLTGGYRGYCLDLYP